MVDISHKSNAESNGAFSAVAGFVSGALRSIDKVLISQGAANARMRKVELLNAKSDDELAMLGLCREDIIKAVFSDYADN
jgi:uncharacterized protein YjiS (DUF1127 family)